MFGNDLQTMTTASRAREKFRLAGGAQPLLLVPVRVNERGPYEFILDTGAGTSILTPALADSLQIKRTGRKQGQTAGGPVNVELATVESLGIGDVRCDNLEVAITDLSQLDRAVGAKIEGDLGYNFLKHFRLTIDFHSSELSLDDPKRAEYFGPLPLTELPMRLAHPAKPLILIEAHLNGRGPFQFAIDTGTSTSAISPELARELNLRGTPIGQATTGGAHIAMTAARAESLRIGRANVADIDLIIGEFLTMLSGIVGCQLDGIVGYNFLRHYRVVIDYPNESFSLFHL